MSATKKFLAAAALLAAGATGQALFTTSTPQAAREEIAAAHDVTTRHGEIAVRVDAGGADVTALVPVEPGTAGQVLTVGDAGIPVWRATAGLTALGVQDGPRLIPLFALANSSSATPAIAGYAGFTPAAYAISGRNTTLTLDAIGQVSGAGLTGTLEVLDAAGSTVATLTWTETTATRKTASITLPGSAEIYRARVSCTGVTDPVTEYALLGGANIRITWS